MNKLLLTLTLLFSATLTFAQPFWVNNDTDDDLYVMLGYQTAPCWGESAKENQSIASGSSFLFDIPPGYLLTVVSVYSFATGNYGVFYSPCDGGPCGTDDTSDYWPSWDCGSPMGISISD